ncbi:MAG: enolase [Clostridiales bacterium]|jgi:hypothetical protein|nr:enolase [Clostridiales bacterium]
MNTEIVYVAVITIISYLIAQSVKATPLDSKWIPVICGVSGAFLGYIGLLVMPDFPANDPLTAVAVGIVSGLAATGSHEMIKQMAGKSYDSDKQ